MLLRCLALAALSVQAPLARSVEIWSTDPIAVDIEWITIDAGGKQTITARKQTAAGPPARLEFVHAADRFVRFSYQGASPRTYSTSELLTARKLHVPDVLPGGELQIVVPPMRVRPAHLIVEGPRVRTLSIAGAPHVSLSGVPPGEYRVTPVYEGGIRSAVRTVRVETARSTLLFLPPEDVGAVRITAIPDVCRTATEAGVNSLIIPNVGAQFQTAPNRSRVFTSNKPECDMTIAGLKPGRHEVYFRRQQSGLGTREFTASSQEIAHADLTGPPVLVEGRVTLNGKPIKDASVTFSWRGKSDASTVPPVGSEVKVDAGGYYSVPLEMPGKYLVMSRPTNPAVPPREVEFFEGRNMHDIAIAGGTIRIIVTGINPKMPVSVRLQSAISMRSSVFGGGHEGPIEMTALPWGEYKVSVGAGMGVVRDNLPNAKTASLSAANPEITLTFNLAGR